MTHAAWPRQPTTNCWESLNDGNTNLLAAGPSADSQVGGGNKTKATTARRYRDESREVVRYQGSFHAFLSQTHPARIAADQPAVALQKSWPTRPPAAQAEGPVRGPGVRHAAESRGPQEAGHQGPPGATTDGLE
jgi:hypothetical protein